MAYSPFVLYCVKLQGEIFFTQTWFTYEECFVKWLHSLINICTSKTIKISLLFSHFHHKTLYFEIWKSKKRFLNFDFEKSSFKQISLGALNQRWLIRARGRQEWKDNEEPTNKNVENTIFFYRTRTKNKNNWRKFVILMNKKPLKIIFKRTRTASLFLSFSGVKIRPKLQTTVWKFIERKEMAFFI